MYYIASPFFTPEAKQRIKEIKDHLNKVELKFYSPGDAGIDFKVLMTKDPVLDQFLIDRIFKENIDEIDKALKLIGIIDNFDKGTWFEIGYFAAKQGSSQACLKNLRLIGNNPDLLNEVSIRLKTLFDKKYMELEEPTHINNAHRLLFKTTDHLWVANGIAAVDLADTMNYIDIGFLYAQEIRLITYSNKPLDASLMASPVTSKHFSGVSYDQLSSQLGSGLHHIKLSEILSSVVKEAKSTR